MSLRDCNHITARPSCPCGSQYVIHAGRNSAGTQRYECKKCGERFIPEAPKVERWKGEIVQPRTPIHERVLSRNPFEHMELAMSTRRRGQ